MRMAQRDVHVLSLYQCLDELVHGGLLTDRKVNGLATANRTFWALLMLEGEGVYALCPNEHEIVVEHGSRTRRNLECLVTA